MNKLTIEGMDLNTHEGRLLQAAIIEITTGLHTNKTPYEVIDLLYDIAKRTDEANKVKTTWTDKGNVYWQSDRLAKTLQEFYPNEIKEGGAVDNAIMLLIQHKENEQKKVVVKEV